MAKDIKQLADLFRHYYKCDNAPGVVENMIMAVAGRAPGENGDLNADELSKVSMFMRNPPFKAKLIFTENEKTVIYMGLLSGSFIAIWAWCTA